MEIKEPQLIDAKQPKKYIPNKIIKTTLCLALVLAYAIYRFTYIFPNTSCISDAYHNFTITLNRNLVTEEGPAFQGNSNQLTVFGKIFIGLGQVLMDLWIAIMAGIWLIKTHNLRAMAGIALFYLIRGTIFLNLMKFPYPAYLAWRSPGFFSVTVPYDHTRDFFFSGHCGGLSVVMCEMFSLGLIKTGALSMISLLYMANMLLTTQVHYTIDIIAGILFGIFFFRIANKNTVFFDKFMSLPFVAGKKVWECLGKDDEDIQLQTVGSQGPHTQNEQKKQARRSQSDQVLADQDVNVQILIEQRSEE